MMLLEQTPLLLQDVAALETTKHFTFGLLSVKSHSGPVEIQCVEPDQRCVSLEKRARTHNEPARGDCCQSLHPCWKCRDSWSVCTFRNFR